ncbi:unnamed protein product [Adineta steineri]|uniref:Uncharacterized protein n=1 Tax=Adineta steineri TaxID=433720 RepID=A0A815W4Z1_9BILA|nr:unnamed protein product [Adineta steineri]CAF1536401.1 unnamed protein product [Adineta steineri]CAF1655683.1 unnamed protein product [Adineta steineri]CAF1655692.1 unnamed protein product [Adineta steineri]
MNVSSRCSGLFVDINDTLYCSIFDRHQVVKRSLSNSVMTSNSVAAGTGTGGSNSSQLNGPRGIFVDVNLDLYVADCLNDRVQMFQSGKSNAVTAAGSKSRYPTIALDCPTGVILDTDKSLFIVDRDHHRIIGSSLNGFRCLIGCYGTGLPFHEMYNPFSFSFSFDRYGNIFVTDLKNSRIQKFEYIEESCGKFKMVE